MRINQIIGDYQFDCVSFALFETIDYVCVINHSNTCVFGKNAGTFLKS